MQGRVCGGELFAQGGAFLVRFALGVEYAQLRHEHFLGRERAYACGRELPVEAYRLEHGLEKPAYPAGQGVFQRFRLFLVFERGDCVLGFRRRVDYGFLGGRRIFVGQGFEDFRGYLALFLYLRDFAFVEKPAAFENFYLAGVEFGGGGRLFNQGVVVFGKFRFSGRVLQT